VAAEACIEKAAAALLEDELAAALLEDELAAALVEEGTRRGWIWWPNKMYWDTFGPIGHGRCTSSGSNSQNVLHESQTDYIRWR
jgi:hypothetical protein